MTSSENKMRINDNLVISMLFTWWDWAGSVNNENDFLLENVNKIPHDFWLCNSIIV